MYCTWEPESTLKLTCAELIAQFKSRRLEREPGALSFVMTHKSPTMVTEEPLELDDGRIRYSRTENNPVIELLFMRGIPLKKFIAPA